MAPVITEMKKRKGKKRQVYSLEKEEDEVR